jgi:4-methyl-5(b-hydroxyethyl)-thiazole monophosphate biosynthesis
MKNATVIFADGCEEGEALTIVDILRRCEIDCRMTALKDVHVKGAHDIEMVCDEVLNESLETDVIILPGGYEGVDKMKESSLLRDILKKRNENGQLIAAICAAPAVLYEAGILDGRKWTCYPGVADQLSAGTYTAEKFVTDGNLLTAKGPAMAWAFAYKIADMLGADSLSVKKRMVYFNAFDVKEDE